MRDIHMIGNMIGTSVVIVCRHKVMPRSSGIKSGGQVNQSTQEVLIQ
jgi:hypothetical protein